MAHRADVLRIEDDHIILSGHKRSDVSIELTVHLQTGPLKTCPFRHQEVDNDEDELPLIRMDTARLGK